MKQCDRCHKAASVWTGSWFNMQDICMACAKVEQAHPDYDTAKEAEATAVKAGEMKFPGVGWPGIEGRLSGDP